MISEIRAGVTIRRPRREIAAVMFDLHFLPGWLGSVRDMEVESGDPPAAGAIVAMIGGRLPLRRVDVFEIAEHRPDVLLVLRGDVRTMKFELEGVPVGTVVWLQIEIERRGFKRLFSPWLNYRTRRQAIRDLRRLKVFIESGEFRSWFQAAEAATED